MTNHTQHIAVVGAGIVGVSCALWLQHKGFKVTLVDGNEPGSMTSSGSACTIANYGCIPVNSPHLVSNLPKLVFGKDSPLSISLPHTIARLSWMLSFLRQSKQHNVDKIVKALGSILKLTNDGLDPLISMTKTQDLFESNGCMYVYASEKEFENARPSNHARAEQGVEFSELDGNEIHDLEPNLSDRFVKGLIFRNARQVLNPKTLVDRYFQSFRDAGGEYVSEHAQGILHGNNGLRIYLASRKHFDVHKIVISSGAWSRQIEGCDSEKLPLNTERGYHIQYAGQQQLVNRPVAWAEAGFYASPMGEGLRIAGTVEIAGLSTKENSRNLRYLEQKANQMLKLSGSPTSTWLGHRPTLPDSLPVIGPSIKSPNTYYAFGHQHIGLTLAGITGKIISELVADEEPCMDISSFLPDRFSKKQSTQF